MELKIEENFLYNIGSTFHDETIHFCIPDRLVKDGKVKAKITGNIPVEDYIITGISWESVLLALGRFGIHISIMLDNYAFKNNDVYLLLHECL